MNTFTETTAFDRAVALVLRQVFPELKQRLVVEFTPDPEILARVELLAERNTEGQLTESELAEYHGYVRANKFIATLKRQLQRIVDPQV